MFCSLRSILIGLTIVFLQPESLWCDDVTSNPVTVAVDCSHPVAGPLHLWGYVNVSRRAPPPVELGSVIERQFGRPKVTRCWLMLDQMWDYRDDQFRFDYEINRDYYVGDPNKKRYGVAGETTGLHYYDYIDSVSASSDCVLLNIRRYEREVLSGMLALEKWKRVFKAAVKHYKLRCPNLRYIEVLNEPTAKNQSNLGDIKHYYQFYRCAYQAINELNAELQPEMPLLVGGNSGFRTREAIHLIQDFARDNDPAKRLDFLSFHHYWANDRPAQVAEWESEIDTALAQVGLSTDIPIFVTEIGYTLSWRTDANKNLWQAAGMTAYQYFACHADDLRLFPWVQFHSPAQIALVQFDPQLRITPYGAAVKMLRMHRSQEVRSESTGLSPNGNGVGCLATMDGGQLVIQLWNLSPKRRDSVNVEVTVRQFPEPLRNSLCQFRHYQIDSQHSQVLAKPRKTSGLEMTDQWQADGQSSFKLTTRMEPMALDLWTIQSASVPGFKVPD